MVAEKLAKSLRRCLPAYPLPVFWVARLAVDERFQGHGVGRLLLRSMLELALDMGDRIDSSFKGYQYLVTVRES